MPSMAAYSTLLADRDETKSRSLSLMLRNQATLGLAKETKRIQA